MSEVATGGRGQSYRTEPLTCRIWCYLQVDSFRIELIVGNSDGVRELLGGVWTPAPMLLNSGLTARCSKANTFERQVLVGMERLLYARDRQLVSKNQLQRFCSTMKVFKGRLISGEGQGPYYLPLCADFLLTGWWWGNRVTFQESCAQPEVTIFHLGGSLSSTEELKGIAVYIPWGGTRTSPHRCTIAFFIFFLFKQKVTKIIIILISSLSPM